MEKNRLYVALVVLGLLVLATFLVYRKPTDDGPERLDNPWGRIERAQITKIVIERPGGNNNTIELEKRDNAWFMLRPAQGPTDEQSVNDALEALSELRMAAVATREPGSHRDMEVDQEHAIHVQVFRGSTRAMDLFFGKNLDSGTALRLASGPFVYRTERSVRSSFTREVREWRDRNVTRIARNDLQWVQWANARGTWRFDRNGETWTAAASNPPVERLDTARVNQVVSNLLELRATDFAEAGANTGITATSPSVRFHLSNGPEIVVKLGATQGDSDVYAQREGNDIVFRIARARSGDIDLDLSNIQAPLPPDGGADAAADASAEPAAPQIVPGGPGGPGGGSVPPEIMEQIRRQLQQRGMGAPPAGR